MTHASTEFHAVQNKTNLFYYRHFKTINLHSKLSKQNICTLSTHAAHAYETEKNDVISACFLLYSVFSILRNMALPLPLRNSSTLLHHHLGQIYKGSHSQWSLSRAREGAAWFHLPPTAGNKPLPINEPEALQILSASPWCHQHSQQPAPASSKTVPVHTKEHEAKNQVS